MARIITKELALKISEKLKARPIGTRRGPHENYGVFYNEKLIAMFGIRRGSSKDLGHDHIQKNLNVSTGFAKQLGICTKSRDDYLREQGLLEVSEEPPRDGKMQS